MTFGYQALVLQGVLGYTALGAGAIGACRSGILLSVLSTRVGTLAGRIGARPFLVAGPLLMAAGLLWFARLPADSEPWKAAFERPATLIPPLDVLIDVAAGVLLFGIGISLVVAPLTSTLMGSIPGRFSGPRVGDQQLDLAGRPAARSGRSSSSRSARRSTRRSAHSAPGPRHVVAGGPRRVPAAQPAAGRCDRRAGRGRHAGLDRRLPPRDARVRPGCWSSAALVSWFGLRPGPSPGRGPDVTGRSGRRLATVGRPGRQPRTRNGSPWPGMTMSAAARTRSRPRSIAAWSAPSGSISGVRSACHQRWVRA